jgi:hypothetical protein
MGEGFRIWDSGFRDGDVAQREQVSRVIVWIDRGGDGINRRCTQIKPDETRNGIYLF